MHSNAEHTLKAFDEDLDILRALILRMGHLAEAAVAASVQALIQGDVEIAAKVVEGDRDIDSLQSAVEGMAVQLIAIRSPVADDLRDVVGAFKIAGMIERVGDYAKNIAKRVPILRNGPALAPLSLFPEMSASVSAMVEDALDAFMRRDPEKAIAVCRRDASVDGHHNAIFRALLAVMTEDPQSITAATHLLFVAKHLERIGDQATNMAEMAYFAATGEHFAERTREDPLLDRTS